MQNLTPGYKMLFDSGLLQKQADALWRILSHCTLCPWSCGVDRTGGEAGRCRASLELKVARALPHFGEEPAVSGKRGSGTIFFSHCHLRCCFCQNYQISQNGLGETLSVEGLAQKMLSLQEHGCHNINLVSPTHYLPHIVRALCIASAHGLLLPLVYNSNGYESVDALRLLSGIIDVYLPDAKYGDASLAEKYSQAKDYTKINLDALREMYKQVGPLVVDTGGIAQKGLIIRHLVLPDNLSGTEAVLKKIKTNLGLPIHISLMGQYQPVFKAATYPELNRRLSPAEYDRAREILENLGFENGWFQEPENVDGKFLPDFLKSDSWN